MTTTYEGWEVLDEEAGVLTREYAFTPGALARMMTARCADGSLLAISPAMHMNDAAFKALEAFGPVSALVAPNGMHHLGLPEWTAVFPAAKVCAPTSAAKRISKKHPELRSVQDLDAVRLGEGMSLDAAPAQRIGEAWLHARGEVGNIWYVSDTFFSLAELPAKLVPRLLFKWGKTAPGFRLNRLSLKMFAKDKPAYRDWMLTKLNAEAPDVIVTAHGDVVRGPDLKARCIGEIEAAIGVA